MSTLNIFDHCEQPMNVMNVALIAIAIVVIIVIIYYLRRQTMVSGDISVYQNKLEPMQGSMRDTSQWTSGSRVFGVPITKDDLKLERKADGVTVNVPAMIGELVPWHVDLSPHVPPAGSRAVMHAGK